MEELLNKLIEVDKNARKRVSKAKKANAAAMEELETKKARLKSDSEEKFAKELENERQKQSLLLKEASEKIDNDCRATIEKMENLCSAQSTAWIDSIVDGVING